MDCPRVGYAEFNAASMHVLKADGYISMADQVNRTVTYRLILTNIVVQEDKVVQMYETMMTRHSTMLVGPTGGGKTVVLNALIKAQCHMGLPTRCQTLNPKVSNISGAQTLSIIFPRRPAPSLNYMVVWIRPAVTG